MSETRRTGEHMMRAWVDADLGQHIHAAAAGPEGAFHLEEAIVSFGHEVFELGRAWERGEITIEEGKLYLRGFFDAIKIVEGDI